MNPVLFNLGSFPVYAYGVFAALAVLAAILYSQGLATRCGLDRTRAMDLIFVLFVSGILGARLFFVLQHHSDYQNRLWETLWIREGGLVWYGGFLTAMLTGVLYGRWHRLEPGPWFDFFAPALAFAHGVGRIGCFWNGCCYGKIGSIPVQLLEAGGLFLLSAYLTVRLARSHRRWDVFLEYVLGYSTLRFFLEFGRADQTLYASLTVPQWMSLLLGVVGACIRLIKK